MKPNPKSLASLLSLFAVLVVASGEPPASNPKPPSPIPADAEFFNGKWYSVYMVKGRWTAARNKCSALSGQLAVVPDEQTHDFIKKLARGRSVWLGATNEKKSSEKAAEWTWVDGTKMEFKAWDQGEPSGSGAKKHEDFMHMRASGAWNDAPDNDPNVFGYICEWKKK